MVAAAGAPSGGSYDEPLAALIHDHVLELSLTLFFAHLANGLRTYLVQVWPIIRIELDAERQRHSIEIDGHITGDGPLN